MIGLVTLFYPKIDIYSQALLKLSMWEYTDKVKEYFLQPKNIGEEIVVEAQ